MPVEEYRLPAVAPVESLGTDGNSYSRVHSSSTRSSAGSAAIVPIFAAVAYRHYKGPTVVSIERQESSSSIQSQRVKFRCPRERRWRWICFGGVRGTKRSFG